MYFADGQIFKGDKVYSQKFEKVTSLPTAPSQGVVYVFPDFSAKLYTGVDYVDIAVGTVGEIGDDTANDAKVATQAAIKAYLAKKLEGMGSTDQLQTKIDKAKDEAIKSATETAATDATNKVNEAKTELQKQIDAKVASVFKFKGSLDNKTALDAIEGMIVGDVYHTSDDGKEYVYTGEEWELLGFTIDLSAYATTESVTKAINDKFNELTKSLENYYNKDQIDGKVTELTGAIATAKQEAITAAATDAQSKADKMHYPMRRLMPMV